MSNSTTPTTPTAPTPIDNLTMDDLNAQEAQLKQEKIDRLRRAMFEIQQIKRPINSKNKLGSPIHITADYLDVETETVYGWLTVSRNASIPKFKLKAIEGYASELRAEYEIKHKKPFCFNLDKNNEEDW